MKVVLTGSNGQLGKTISLLRPKGIDLVSLTREDIDLKNNFECYEKIARLEPDWLINAAAYTAVDLAEDNIKKAFDVNCEAPKQFSKVLKKYGGNLLQISTDYVFDGDSNKPYSPLDKVNPINIYGKSKAAGEQVINDILAETKQSSIIRTSWLMSPFKNNFATTIFSLLKNKDNISIVNDQVGSPTSCESLAKTCWRVINIKNSNSISIPNILHWSNIGQASWYEIANYIYKTSKKKNLISNNSTINPISTNEYKFKANRPMFSVLDSSLTSKILNFKNISWEKAIESIIYYKLKNKNN